MAFLFNPAYLHETDAVSMYFNYLSVANRYRFMREVGTDECTQGNSTWRCYSLVSLKIELRSIHCATLTCGKPWWDMMNFCLSNTGM